MPFLVSLRGIGSEPHRLWPLFSVNRILEHRIVPTKALVVARAERRRRMRKALPAGRTEDGLPAGRVAPEIFRPSPQVRKNRQKKGLLQKFLLRYVNKT